MNTQVAKTVDGFFSKYTKLVYKKGEIILRAGDPPTGVLYLKKGFVRQSFVAENGDMLVLHVYRPGSFFPMTWVMNDTPNRYYFEAIKPVELVRAPREEVKKFLKDHPEVIEDFTQRILSGLTGVMQRMEHLVFESAYKKSVLLLLYYINNLTPEMTDGVFPITLTHRELAAWIGTTRETASLQIEALKAKGLISYNKRQLMIHDVKKLEKEIS